MSRNIDIEELITLNYEIEGLLYMALHRGADTPDGVWRLIREKVYSLSTALSEEDNNDISLIESEPNKAANSKSDDYVKEPEVSESEQSGSFESKEDISGNDESFSGPDNDISSEEPVSPDAPCVAPEAIECENDLFVPNSDKVESAEIDSDTKIATDEDDDIAKDAEQDEEPVIRLDEKLARDNSKNLRKAFSVNDKFRFRRELFSNSDTEMTDTLNLVEAMSSYSEAEEYFFTDLQWDPDLTEVSDFMAIIRKHFS